MSNIITTNSDRLTPYEVEQTHDPSPPSLEERVTAIEEELRSFPTVEIRHGKTMDFGLITANHRQRLNQQKTWLKDNSSRITVLEDQVERVLSLLEQITIQLKERTE